MARAVTPILYSGKIHNLIYRVRNGRQQAYLAPVYSKEKHKQRMKGEGSDRDMYDSYRGNINEFAGASKVACAIYRDLRPAREDSLGPVFRPYSQNLLTARVKRYAEYRNKRKHKRGGWYAAEIGTADIRRALQGLDLGHEGAPASSVRMEAIGPHHNPTAIRVHGLRTAAEAVRTHGNARLELRFHIRQAGFDELALSKDGKWREKATDRDPLGSNHWSEPSGWIPTEIIPAEGFLLDLPQREEGATLVTAVMVEWREVRPTGRRIVRHHNMAIVRIVSVHGQAEDSEEQANRTESHHTMPMAFQQELVQPLTARTMDPAEYIAHALSRLKKS